MGKELITLVLCSAWSTAAGSSRPAQLQTLQLLLTCCTTWPSAPEVNTHLDTIVIFRHCTIRAGASVEALSGAERSRLKACLVICREGGFRPGCMAAGILGACCSRAGAAASRRP